jgi:hypothetical protein
MLAAKKLSDFLACEIRLLNCFSDRSSVYNGYRGVAELYLAELPMLAAAYRGVFNVNFTDRFDVVPYCPTGNCTWTQPYTSLGTCGKCVDVTELIVSSDSLSTARNPLTVWVSFTGTC